MAQCNSTFAWGAAGKVPSTKQGVMSRMIYLLEATLTIASVQIVTIRNQLTNHIQINSTKNKFHSNKVNSSVISLYDGICDELCADPFDEYVFPRNLSEAKLTKLQSNKATGNMLCLFILYLFGK